MASSSPSGGALEFEFAALREARNYRRSIAREFAPSLHGRVLEVGAGIGQMTAEFQRLAAVTALTCIEPDPAFATRLAEAHPGVSVVRGTTGSVPPGETWDALVSINVLEHIEDDAAELRRWAALLAPTTGRACLLVPARPELYAPIDRDFGHWRRYAKPGLRRKLEEAGFAIERLHYFNLAGYFGWWLTFRLLGRRRFDPLSVRTFDRAIFPVMHWLETRILRPPFGQSLIAVARVAA